MSKLKDTEEMRKFWDQRYQNQAAGWDIGFPSTPLKTYIDQIINKDLRILIPGAGNAYEAEYLWKKGFSKVYVMDIAQAPLKAFAERNPKFPKSQLLQRNFFVHSGQYDLIIEQTFFCSFTPRPENRQAYVHKMHELLAPQGKLVGLWFTFPIRSGQDKPPYGGTKEEYLSYFVDYFEVLTFEPARNSIKPRQGKELFGILKKKGTKIEEV